MSNQKLNIAMVAVISSQLAGVGYDAESKTLRITFAKRKDGTPGSSYDYADVEPETHEAMMAAESVGSYFHKNIKPNAEKYPYTKLEAHAAVPPLFLVSPLPNGQWNVFENGYVKQLATFDDREDAVEYAEDLAGTRAGATVRIQETETASAAAA